MAVTVVAIQPINDIVELGTMTRRFLVAVVGPVPVRRPARDDVTQRRGAVRSAPRPSSLALAICVDVMAPLIGTSEMLPTDKQIASYPDRDDKQRREPVRQWVVEWSSVGCNPVQGALSRDAEQAVAVQRAG